MMKSVQAALGLGLLAGTLFLTGCATVISGREATVSITSQPPAAQVVVRNDKGETVATGVTPAQVSLKRGKGVFKRAPRYVATLEKPGYQRSQIPIQPKVNPWIIGNIAIGGVIGLAADSATGAMWRFTPKEIHQDLTPFEGPFYSQSPNGQPPTDEIAPAAFISDNSSEHSVWQQ